VIRTFQLPSPGFSPRLKRRERTPAAEGGTMGEKLPRILPKVATSASLLGSFTCRKLRHGTEGFTSSPKEGALRIFFARKIRRLRPGLNPRTWVLKASTLNSRPPKPPIVIYWNIKCKIYNAKYHGIIETYRVMYTVTPINLVCPDVLSPVGELLPADGCGSSNHV